MEGNMQSPISGKDVSTPSSGSSAPRRPSQQQLSCTHCRQRKIKCDKTHPCTPCQKSVLNCVFPERVRHPKRRHNESKASNDELMRRLKRMEELLEKMKEDEKDEKDTNVPTDGALQSTGDVQTERTISEGAKPRESDTTDVNRFIGSAYWRSLTNEVEGLRQTMDDVSDEEEGSPASTQSTANTPHSLIVFGASPVTSKELRLLHPSPDHMLLLCDMYGRNVEPMFKLMHMPTFRKLVTSAASNTHEIPSGNYVEPLLFSMYYAAITTLTQEECLLDFQEGRDSLLVKYRTGAETAMVNADIMNTNELGTMQALVIFMLAVRANDESQLSWTLVGLAVRLGQAIGLHRENSKSGLSPFTTEVRRRLWWQLVTLDMRACEERGSDPVILPGSFNTRMPLNIDDADLSPEAKVLPAERHAFTEMTKSKVSHVVWENVIRIAYEQPVQEGEEGIARKSFKERESVLDHLEKELESKVLVYCDTSNPLAWTTSVIARLILARVRLSLYHPPLHDQRLASHHYVSRDTVLKIAVEDIELSHLLDSEPAAAPWRWFFKTYVQWHCLAATLAELCVQNEGPLIERAWRIVDIVFDEWAARIADSKHGMLWRPIKKLMSKAQAKRNETRVNSSKQPLQQQLLPQFESPSNQLDWGDPMPTWALQYCVPETSQNFALDQSTQNDQVPPSDVLASLNVNEPMDTINWAEWDEFMQDFEMPDQSVPTNTSGLQPDDNMVGAWW